MRNLPTDPDTNHSPFEAEVTRTPFYHKLEDNYGNGLVEKVYGDGLYIEELSDNPPEVFLIHGYGGQIDENGRPNAESRYNIRATIELVNYIRNKPAVRESGYKPTMLVSGGTDDPDSGYGFYAQYLINQINRLKLPDNRVIEDFAYIWDEGTYQSYNPNYRKAVGTGGEVEFAMEFLNGMSNPNVPVVSICRLGHHQRIENFAHSHGFNLRTLTTEGILMHFTEQDAIQKFINIFPEHMDSVRNFVSSEQRKALISRLLFDKSEAKTIETLLRFLGGDIKDHLFKLIGQKPVNN